MIRVQQDVSEAVKAYEATMQEYDEAVAAAKEAAGEDGEPEEVPDPDFSEQPVQVLGGRARAIMAEGKEVPDDLLVDFIIEKVRGLEGSGYLLDGFPCTVEQARALEQKLAGVEDVHILPKPQPPASRLAPAPPEEEKEDVALPSALTMHVRLHVDKEISLRRRVGRLFDPEDEEKCTATYHFEFDPPPEEDSALRARLIEAPDPDNADLLTRISSYADERPLLASWLSRFGAVASEVDSTDGVDDVAANILEVVQKRIEDLKPPQPDDEEGDEAAEAEPEPAAEEDAAAEEGEVEEAAEAPAEAEGDEVEAEAAKPFEPVDIHPDMARMLLEQWQGCEGEFVSNMQRLMRSVRNDHRQAVNWVAESRNRYISMLQQPSAEKQKLVHAFQAKFNSIDMEVRVMEESKREMHERVDDLRDKLWEKADEQRQAAEDERAAVMEDSYLTDCSTMIVSYMIEMVQQEAHRYQATECLLRDYHYARAAKEVPVETAPALNLVEKYVDGEFNGELVASCHAKCGGGGAWCNVLVCVVAAGGSLCFLSIWLAWHEV